MAEGTATFTSLAPGAYSYTVSANNYQASQTITATVTAGQTTPSQASLTQVQPTSNAPASYTLYIAAGTAALIVLLGVFLGLRRRRASTGKTEGQLTRNTEQRALALLAKKPRTSPESRSVRDY